MKWTVIKGILAGVVFASAGYWLIVLSWVIDSFYVIIGATVAVNIAVGFLLAGKTYLEMFTGWALSIIPGIITFIIYGYSGFLNKCLNFVSPGYGEMSAGTGWASMIIFTQLFFCFIIAVIVAVITTEINKKRLAGKSAEKV